MNQDQWKNYDRFKHDNAVAENYYGCVHACFAEGLKRVAGARRFRRALDIACGSGDSTAQLLPFADAVGGIDLSPALIAKARADAGLAGVDFRQGDFLDCPLPQPYDLVTAVWFHDFLHTEAAQQRALEKIHAALAEGGAIVFLIPSAAFASAKSQAYFARLGWRQAWHEHGARCSRGVFSFRDSPWAPLTCWQPLYLFELYQRHFDLGFVDTKKICVEGGYLDAAYLEPTFEVMYGTRRD